MRSASTHLILLAAALGATPALAEEALQRQVDYQPFSLLDGSTLGDHRMGFGFGAGFPYVQAMGGYNLAPGIDADVNIDSLYGIDAIFSVGPKFRLLQSGGAALAVEVQGQYAWFRTPETGDNSTSQGARYLTGIRNWDFEIQSIVSYKGRYGSVFGTLFYQGTFDTEPVTQGPLAGNPGPWTYGSNLGGHLGCEVVPFGIVHAYGVLGLEVHLRSEDVIAIPVVELGFAFPS